MAYKRYKSEIALSKPEKVNLMSEYIDYYERLINEQGLLHRPRMRQNSQMPFVSLSVMKGAF